MIALLEDDDSIRKLVLYALESQGFTAAGYALPSQFLASLETQMPELLLLDIMLPEQDGLEILKSLRANAQTQRLPVILLTAKNSEYDRIIGLDNGADDFICKPFSMLELIARIRAVLRRAAPAPAVQEYVLDGLRIDLRSRTVRSSEAEIALTLKEFDLLRLLLENRGHVLTRDLIMERVWGVESERENRTLDVHIRTLRAKLGSAGASIETVRGVGYRIGGGKT